MPHFDEASFLLSIKVCYMKTFIFLIISVLVIFSSCSGNISSNKIYYEVNTTHKMHLTSEDTILVTSIVNQFMDLYTEGKYTDAAAMLYSQKIQKSEPQLLDNDELQSTISMLKNNPIKSYTLNSITFNNAENNEVKCKIVTKNDISMNFTFKPIRYLGGWRLCLKQN